MFNSPNLWKVPWSMNSDADGTYTTSRPEARPQSASAASAMLLPLPAEYQFALGLAVTGTVSAVGNQDASHQGFPKSIGLTKGQGYVETAAGS